MSNAIEFDIASLVHEMTPEEAARVFKTQSRRANNYAAYLMLINSLKVGGQRSVDIPADRKTAEDRLDAARELKYNLNEAAKERTEFVEVSLTEDEAKQVAENKKIDRFERNLTGDGEPKLETITRGKDGKWRKEVPAPVILRFVTDTHEEEVEVTDKEGKKVKTKVNVPDRLHMVLNEWHAPRKRAKRSKDAQNGPVTVTVDPSIVTPNGANGTAEGAPAAPEGAPAAAS